MLEVSSEQWRSQFFTYIYARLPFGVCATWNPGGDASWWKGTRRLYSSSHTIFVSEENKLSKTQQDRSSCWLVLLLTLNIIYTRTAIPLSTIIYLWTLLYSYSCGSQVKAQPSSGHIFHARSCVRRNYPSEVMEIVSYCTKNGRMSRKVVSGKYLPSPNNVWRHWRHSRS